VSLEEERDKEKDNKIPSDDKRFFSSVPSGDAGGKDGKKDEERPKIPLDLPDINMPKKEPPGPQETPSGTPQPSQPVQPAVPPQEKQDKAPAPEPKSAEKPPAPAKPAKTEKLKVLNGKLASGKKTVDEWAKKNIASGDLLVKMRPAMPVIFVLCALLGTFAILLAYQIAHITSLKERIGVDATTTEDMVLAKEGLIEENRELEEEVDRLRKELLSSASLAESSKRQSESLKAELDDAKKKYVELKSTVKDYASEMRSFAARNVGYYDAYKKEEEGSQKLAAVIQDMESRMGQLKTKMDSIDASYRKKEGAYIYNTGLLYAETGAYEDAIQSFLKYIEIVGDDANTYYNLAYIYEHAKHDIKEAQKYYKKYLALGKGSEDYYEVKMKIASLERSGPQEKLGYGRVFKLDLDKLKY